MSHIQLTHADGVAVIEIQGSFTFEVNREFREVYQRIPGNKPVVVDLSQAAYIDSAGLGMLIRLREHAGGGAGSVRLIGANSTIQSILEVANFGRLFKIG